LAEEAKHCPARHVEIDTAERAYVAKGLRDASSADRKVAPVV
jgi:hypothetical protein